MAQITRRQVTWFFLKLQLTELLLAELYAGFCHLTRGSVTRGFWDFGAVLYPIFYPIAHAIAFALYFPFAWAALYVVAVRLGWEFWNLLAANILIYLLYVIAVLYPFQGGFESSPYGLLSYIPYYAAATILFHGLSIWIVGRRKGLSIRAGLKTIGRITGFWLLLRLFEYLAAQLCMLAYGLNHAIATFEASPIGQTVSLKVVRKGTDWFGWETWPIYDAVHFDAYALYFPLSWAVLILLVLKFGWSLQKLLIANCMTYILYAVTWCGLTYAFTKWSSFESGLSAILDHFALLTVLHAISVLVLYRWFRPPKGSRSTASLAST